MQTISPAPTARGPRPWAGRLPPPLVMMGVPFDQATMDDAIAIILEMIASGRPHLLATANVNFLAQANRDPDQHRILVNADLVVCDGTPLIWMSRLLGDPLPGRVAGSDLVPLLLDLAEQRGLGVYFLGGRDEVVAEAEKRIRARWPKLRVAGMYSPPFAPIEKMDHADIRARIRATRPDILLVSFGCPKQEKWLEINFREAGVPVNIGVGGTIDFLAGATKRAPMWMRRCGLEWLHRVAQEPGRLAGRYWTDFWAVMPALLRQWLTMRRRGSPAAPPPVVPVPPAPPPSARDVPPLVLTLPARLDALTARDPALRATADASTAAFIVADVSAVTFLDSTGAGFLARLSRAARERGGRCVLAGATAAVTGPLDLMKLRGFFDEAPDVASARASVIAGSGHA